jgi:transposase
VPGVERQPLKKLAVDESALLKLLHRWREEAAKAGHRIKRIAVAFEAGRDSFWLARWLRARGIEAHVIHASSVAVSREHRRAKTDRLDTELLKRAFIGWLRGERDHCKMVAIPTTKDEDAKRPNRERQSLVGEQTRIVNRMKAALIRLGIRGFNPKLKKAAGRLEDLRTPEGEPYRPTRWLSCVATWSAGGSSVIRSARSRRLAWNASSRHPVMDTRHGAPAGAGDRGWHRDGRHAGAGGAGAKHARPTSRSALCGSHWRTRRERQQTARERAGPFRQRSSSARHDPIGVAISHVPEGERLGAVVSSPHRDRPWHCKTVIVALARKLLIALWRLVREGVVPDGVVLRPAQ